MVLCNRPRQVARTLLFPPSLVVSVLLRCRLRCPARGVYPATQTAPVAPVLIHISRCTAIIFSAATNPRSGGGGGGGSGGGSGGGGEGGDGRLNLPEAK